MYAAKLIKHTALITALTISTAACAGMYGGSDTTALTDLTGRTVYSFDKDSAHPPVSNCSGGCLGKWPPVPAGAISGKWVGEFQRDDGIAQATFRDQPVYYFAGDQKAGERNGDKLGGVWHVIETRSESSAAY